MATKWQLRDPQGQDDVPPLVINVLSPCVSTSKCMLGCLQFDLIVEVLFSSLPNAARVLFFNLFLLKTIRSRSRSWPPAVFLTSHIDFSIIKLLANSS